jgi:NAD(P)-dependent dehydrogenase (short-subunit alcohol dehydrogenase family)
MEQRGVQTHQCDYSEAALAALAIQLQEESADIRRLIICNGVLQGEGYRPERALNQLKTSAMEQVFEVNTFLPMRVLAFLAPVIKRSSAPRIAVLSARVGSIGDNGLGGWYSYRGSKAALNMMLRCAALEMRRVNSAAKIMAYHPGTVDTPLSQPFQTNVAPEKLFSPERAAKALDTVLSNLEADGELSYLDWRGETIPW